MNYNRERIRKLERLLIPTMKHELENARKPDLKAQYRMILEELELEYQERIQQQFMDRLRISYEGVVA